MKKYLGEFLLAVLAGMAIGIGGVIYLALENKIVGSLMFTVGLYTIVLNGLYLFTGKIGYMVNEKAPYIITLVVTWLGNLCGTFLAAKMVAATRMSSISEAAANASAVKVSQTLWSALLLAIFCGMLMFIAVDGYKQTKNPIILFICVSVFILCGFEHCIADMFYFSLAEVWSPKTLLITLVITVGNSIGGMLIPTVKYICSKSSER